MRHRRRPNRRAVSEVIATILLLAITIIAGVILWTFHVYTPPQPPSAQFDYRSGGSNPVWGDPTDCQPVGVWSYPLSGTLDTTWYNQWNDQCENTVTGNFSALNTTQIIFNQLSSNGLLTSDINFTFVCNGNYAPAPYTEAKTTILLQGTLAQFTWFPGETSSAPAGPYLGYCGGFDMGNEAGVAFGSLFTRLIIFNPLSNDSSYLQNGDSLYLYIHNGGYPLDFACVVRAQGWGGDPSICPNGITAGPLLDVDDYHGTPPWCFSTPLACTIDITYTGSPSTLLGSIPVYDLTPPTGH
jgi:flagellin-like protein